MSLELKVENVVLHIESSINKLKHFIINLTTSGESHDLKRASLLSYWIDTYTEYMKREKTFDFEKLPRYRRGDVLKINFGYRVGNELGGLHYAIVLDNNNSKKSGIITVVPLVSQKEGFTNSHYRQTLNNGLYQLANEKINRETEKNRRFLFEEVKKVQTISASDNKDTIYEEIGEKMLKYQKTQDSINTWKKDIEQLKTGSVVDFGQIITISKQRIYEPIKTSDLLYHIRISNDDMDMINRKLSLGYLKQTTK